MKHWLWITLLTTGLASWVLAQEPEQTTPEQPAAESEPVNTAPENAGYLPSEEISDDLSVSFPVDI